MSTIDNVRDHVERVWTDDVLPSLMDYIEIPCVSVHFDPDWRTHGHLDRAVEHLRAWCAARSCAAVMPSVVSGTLERSVR